MPLEMTEKQFQSLANHEGMTNYLYCDTRGYVTIGVGNMLPTADACAKLPLRHTTGALASDAEKRAAWGKVRDAFQNNLSACAYRKVTDLHLDAAAIRGLVQRRMSEEFLPGLVKLFPSIDTWPAAAHDAVVDMVYNLGVKGLSKFTRLVDACLRRDWSLAAQECNRATCRDSRNVWTVDRFLAAQAAERKC